MLTSTSGIDAPVQAAARRWYKQLWIQVLIAMAVGIAIGHYFPDAGVSLQPLGDGFIKLIRMLIALIIFCTVILGIAKMDDISRVGRVAIKGLIYFEVMTTIALVIGLVVVNLWQPGVGMNVNASNLDDGPRDVPPRISMQGTGRRSELGWTCGLSCKTASVD